MRSKLIFLAAVLPVLFACTEGVPASIAPRNPLRAPAYPLITIDPYTNAWSTTENLFDSAPQHWTGKDYPLSGYLTVDGTVYRFMGSGSSIVRSELLPSAATGAWSARYTLDEAGEEWTDPAFDDSAWAEGEGGFGTLSNRGGFNRTSWTEGTIRVRRHFSIPEVPGETVNLILSGNDRSQVWINGTSVYASETSCENKIIELPKEVLRKGENVIAAAAYNEVGRAILDFGILLSSETPADGAVTPIQNLVDVQAMNTDYAFVCGPVGLRLTFTAPFFLDRPELVSRPVNYISYSVSSADQKRHDVSIRFAASPAWAVNFPWQSSASELQETARLVMTRTGSLTQGVLVNKGDDIRIDWGYFHLAGDRKEYTASVEGNVPTLERRLGKVREASGMIMLGYDDIRSIRYFGTDLRPYWNRDGNRTIGDEFEDALSEYPDLMAAARQFDADLYAETAERGGTKYADLCALAYRQSVAAHKLVRSPSGELLFFSKENNSNGSIGTVDVTYPSAPLYLKYGPEFAKGLLNHIFEYSESGRWAKPFPAHDVGTYPVAEGQTYGKDMPVEESGNMIILTAAVAILNGDTDYAAKHWATLTTWAEYLSQFGYDPDTQLCTDDFAGRLAHNVNLAAKAIVALGAYARMADLLGKPDVASKYNSMAREMAAKWQEEAFEADHYRLTYDGEGTWSQKYNLMWDRILGLDLFPPEVMRTELAYYLGKQNRYGLPLDCRMAYTKTDWIVWTATMAEDRETFEALIAPVWDFMNETVDRVPMSDWVWTDKPNRRGFKARSVVGGYFAPLLK